MPRRKTPRSYLRTLPVHVRNQVKAWEARKDQTPRDRMLAQALRQLRAQLCRGGPGDPAWDDARRRYHVAYDLMFAGKPDQALAILTSNAPAPLFEDDLVRLRQEQEQSKVIKFPGVA